MVDVNIENYSDRDELDKYFDLVKKLYNFSRETLGFDKDIKSIVFISNQKNADKPLGKTAYYMPSNEEIAIFADNRHIKDMMRSISHELVHHKQNCAGELYDLNNTELGYAQEDGRNLEKEAYMKGNMIFRDWEDNLKQKRELKESREPASKFYKDKFDFKFEPYGD